MRVEIRKPAFWIGPYQIMEGLFFWAKRKDTNGYYDYPKWVYKLASRLSENKDGEDTKFLKICQYIYKKRTEARAPKVQIDYWDTWSMDYTLAPIILPLLKQLKETSHSFGFIKDEDAPEDLSSTKATGKDYPVFADSNAKARWDWVMDEMIWAFEQLCDKDAELQFHSEDFRKFDSEGMEAWSKRIENGTRLFGVYYQSLWD